MNKRNIVAALPLATLLVLAGCGGAPSEGDVQTAMVKKLEASGAAAFYGDDVKKQLQTVKLVGCAKADAGGYKCDIANSKGGVNNLRFVKVDGNWSVVDN